jgi:glutamate-ammonia-ligase adenylyltransferase
MFLIGVRVVSGTIGAEEAGHAYTALAQQLIAGLQERVETLMRTRHGHLPAGQMAVLGMGKLGSAEMTANSDLDLIIIYDYEGTTVLSDGLKPLSATQYFARATQRLISALSAPTAEGQLYAVDMRLRPSGKAGPVATRFASFVDYQSRAAWTWEHLALTRARVVSASPAFAARVEKVIRDVLCRPRDARTIAADVAEMRAAIATEKGDSDKWDLKYVVGGLIDIEFIAQYLQLVHAAEMPELLDTSTVRVLEKASRLGALAPEDAEILRPAVRLYHDLTQLLRLCLAGPFDPKATAPELLRLLARAADVPDFATLDAFIGETQAKVRASFQRILGKVPAEV